MATTTDQTTEQPTQQLPKGPPARGSNAALAQADSVPGVKQRDAALREGDTPPKPVPPPKQRDEYGAGQRAWRMLAAMSAEEQTRVIAAASSAVNGLREVSSREGAEIIRTLLSLDGRARSRQLEALRDRWEEAQAASRDGQQQG